MGVGTIPSCTLSPQNGSSLGRAAVVCERQSQKTVSVQSTVVEEKGKPMREIETIVSIMNYRLAKAAQVFSFLGVFPVLCS